MVCSDWADPRNVGSAFRLADAVGLENLVLAGATLRPPNKKIQRTSRGTVSHVPWQGVDSAKEYLHDRKVEGAVIIGLEITDSSISLLDFEPPGGKLVLVAGSESGGIATELLALCDHAVHLPMHGSNTSMNVAVAAGAAAYLLLMKLQ